MHLFDYWYSFNCFRILLYSNLLCNFLFFLNLDWILFSLILCRIDDYLFFRFFFFFIRLSFFNNYFRVHFFLFYLHFWLLRRDNEQLFRDFNPWRHSRLSLLEQISQYFGYFDGCQLSSFYQQFLILIGRLSHLLFLRLSIWLFIFLIRRFIIIISFWLYLIIILGNKPIILMHYSWSLFLGNFIFGSRFNSIGSLHRFWG